MTADRYTYCAVYIRGLPDHQHAIELLTPHVNGQREGRRSIHGDTMDIDVLTNPDNTPGADEFLFWPLKVELFPHPTTSAEQTIDITATLLTELWNTGLDAVAACDYEDELPDRGGYPRYQR